MSGFDDRDTPRRVTRSMKNSQAVITEIDAGHIVKPQVHPQRNLVEVVAFVHRDVVIAGDHFRCRQAVGRDHGGFMKVTVGADMVAVLVGVNHQIDVSYFEADLKKAPFEYRKILIAAAIDHDIFVVALDDIAVTASVQTGSEKFPAEVRLPPHSFSLALSSFRLPWRTQDHGKSQTVRQSDRFENSLAGRDSSCRGEECRLVDPLPF